MEDIFFTNENQGTLETMDVLGLMLVLFIWRTAVFLRQLGYFFLIRPLGPLRDSRTLSPSSPTPPSSRTLCCAGFPLTLILACLDWAGLGVVTILLFLSETSFVVGLGMPSDWLKIYYGTLVVTIVLGMIFPLYQMLSSVKPSARAHWRLLSYNANSPLEQLMVKMDQILVRVARPGQTCAVLLGLASGVFLACSGIPPQSTILITTAAALLLFSLVLSGVLHLWMIGFLLQSKIWEGQFRLREGSVVQNNQTRFIRRWHALVVATLLWGLVIPLVLAFFLAGARGLPVVFLLHFLYLQLMWHYSVEKSTVNWRIVRFAADKAVREHTSESHSSTNEPAKNAHAFLVWLYLYGIMV